MVRLKAPPRAQLREQSTGDSKGGIEPQIRAALAFACNTDHIVQWEQLAAHVSHSPPALNESERVQLMLDLANGRTVNLAQWNQLAGARILDGPMEFPIELRDDVRAGLVANFEVMVAGTDADRRALAADCARVASGHTVIVPSWKPDATRADRIVARSMYGALAFGNLLLLDPRRPFREALCRCHYSECRKFFLSISDGKAGAPNRSYCCKPHARRGDTEKARLRMQRLRGTAR